MALPHAGILPKMEYRGESHAGLESCLAKAVGSSVHWLGSSFREPMVLRKAGPPAKRLNWVRPSILQQVKKQNTSLLQSTNQLQFLFHASSLRS